MRSDGAEARETKFMGYRRGVNSLIRYLYAAGRIWLVKNWLAAPYNEIFSRRISREKLKKSLAQEVRQKSDISDRRSKG